MFFLRQVLAHGEVSGALHIAQLAIDGDHGLVEHVMIGPDHFDPQDIPGKKQSLCLDRLGKKFAFLSELFSILMELFVILSGSEGSCLY